MASDDDSAVLAAAAALFAPAAEQVGAALRQRMTALAKDNNAESFWTWIEAQTGRRLAEPARGEMEGHIVGWLQFRQVKGGDKQGADYSQLTKDAFALADALDCLDRDVTYYLPAGNDMYAVERASAGLAPRLRALAEVLAMHGRPRSSVLADKELIHGLGDVYRRAGGRVTSGPSGEFGRLLHAVWQVLPEDQRCATVESFLQYIKTAWDGLPTSPLRRRGQKTQ
jgi:hypothetical protein